MREETKYIGKRRIHCYKCGRFVGEEGYISIPYDDMGDWKEGYSICAICLDKNDKEMVKCRK